MFSPGANISLIRSVLDIESIFFPSFEREFVMSFMISDIQNDVSCEANNSKVLIKVKSLTLLLRTYNFSI